MSLLVGLLVSAWVGITAILSVQNAKLVSLQFLGLQSIQIPLGVLLAFAMIVGLWSVILLRPIWRLTAPRRQDKRPAKSIP
jgi:uncharacterized integral membrane protein